LLRAVRFDLASYSLRGDPVNIVRDVRTAEGVHSYAVSNTGSLVYTPWNRNLPPVALDRDGADAISHPDRVIKRGLSPPPRHQEP